MTDDWDDVVADLATRRDVAGRMGGPERITRQHERGKLDVRARIEALFDPGSFDEIGRLAGELPADAVVTGVGSIDGVAGMRTSGAAGMMRSSISRAMTSSRDRVSRRRRSKRWSNRPG